MFNRTQHLHALLFSVLFLMLALPVQAMDLSTAKARGLIGEQANGYLGLVDTNASEEVRKLVREINRKRRQTYQAIARRNQTSLATVEKLAGRKAIKKTPAGQYIKPAGKWTKK